MSPTEMTREQLPAVHRIQAPIRRQLVDILLNAIVAHRWLPGERLLERELCEGTGASRSSVREALRELEAHGLLEAAPGKGMIVRVFSDKEISSIYEFRAVVEGFAIRAFCERASEKQCEDLELAFEKVAEGVGRGDSTSAVLAADGFYDVIITGADNSMMALAHSRIRGRILLLRGTSALEPGRLSVMLEELRVILHAIQRGDGAEAARLNDAHVALACKAVRSELAREAASTHGSGQST